MLHLLGYVVTFMAGVVAGAAVAMNNGKKTRAALDRLESVVKELREKIGK